MTARTRTDKLEEAHRLLTDAVDALVSGDDWARMLDTAARFHRYSANNIMLILMQNPDATRVAGYRTWQALGRQVRKGESSLRILAPVAYRAKDVDDDGNETVRAGIRGFTTVGVFDISQTDGDPIADIVPEFVTDDPGDLWDRLAVQVVAAGYTIERGDCGGANGRTDPTTKTVRVRDDVPDGQAAKTLVHELAHIALGHVDSLWSYAMCRGTCEVEAESTAFLVLHLAGIDAGGYTFPYVAKWANGDTDLVRKTADRVIKAARTITGAAVDEAVPA